MMSQKQNDAVVFRYFGDSSPFSFHHCASLISFVGDCPAAAKPVNTVQRYKAGYPGVQYRTSMAERSAYQQYKLPDMVIITFYHII